MATLSKAEPNAVEVDEGLIYFRCPNDGWIAAADDGGLELPKKMRMGYVPLDQYGRYGNNPYYAAHPFEPLFQAGGASEMPVDQVIANGFHLWPPAVPTCGKHVGMAGHLAHSNNCWNHSKVVEFPQLEGVDVPGPQECEYCDRDDLPTPEARKQHIAVMHSDRKDQEAIVSGIVSGIKQAGLGGSSLDSLVELLKNPEALAALKALATEPAKKGQAA